jgi:Zinc finger, C2H2 type/Zinc-finger of C2H2 type
VEECEGKVEFLENEDNVAFVVKNIDGKYECDECLKSFKNLKSFVNHIKTHNALADESIKILEEHFKTRTSSPKNISIDRENYCEICKTQFDSRKQLLLHLSIHKNVAEAERRKSLLKQQESDLNCHLCNKTFSSKPEFELHKSVHLQVCENKPYASKKTKLMNTLKQHRVHACQFCGKEFKRPHEKVKHEVSKTNTSIQKET